MNMHNKGWRSRGSLVPMPEVPNVMPDGEGAKPVKPGERVTIAGPGSKSLKPFREGEFSDEDLEIMRRAKAMRKAAPKDAPLTNLQKKMQSGGI